MFKSFIAYKVSRANDDNNLGLPNHIPVIDNTYVAGSGVDLGDALINPLLKIVTDNPSVEPSPVSYSKLGFITPPMFGESAVFNGAMGARLICLQKQERMLPSAVINREFTARAAAVAEREGRALNRQESAQIKDVVVSEFLPKAFIKLTSWMVLFFKDWVIVETSSPKVAEDTLAFIRDCLIKEGDLGSLPLRNLLGETPDVQLMLRNLTVDGFLRGGTLGDSRFTPCHSIKLYSSDKEATSFKDIWPHDNEHVCDLIFEGHVVTEEGVGYSADDDSSNGFDMSFILTKGKVFKSIKWGEHIIDSAKIDAETEDDVVKQTIARFDANVALMSNVITQMLDEIEWLIVPKDKRAKPEDDNSANIAALKRIVDKEGGSLSINGQEVYASTESTGGDHQDPPMEQDDEL